MYLRKLSRILLVIVFFGYLISYNYVKAQEVAPKPKLKSILIKVPFTSQAPTAEWKDERFQAGCEEASVLMVMRWVQGRSLTKLDAKTAILTLANWEQKKYKNYIDTSAQDTAERLIKGFYGYKKYQVKNNITKKDVISALEAGHVILAPMDGRRLKNPNFTAPGPIEHMLVIKGYDEKNDVFITNDPGTRRGESYKYKTEVFMSALRDYPTGKHLPVKDIEKVIIIIER